MYTIIAPHGDDEIIGCFELLSLHKVDKVLYVSGEDACKSRALASFMGFSIDIFDKNDTENIKNTVYLFPDPYFEQHPLHKSIGAIGVEWLNSGKKVWFYSTNMNSPYIREVKFWAKKRELLNMFYPTKQELWQYEHKYFLFEGQVQWIR